MSFPRALAAALALAPAMAAGALAPPAPGGMQMVPRPTPDADALAAAMRRLGADPRDLDALITAGELSLKLGDAGGAASLFKRAEQLSPLNGRVRAGMARILVTQERPGEALRYFDQAIGFGLDPRSFAGDRGLAYDLIGEQERAQRDYRAALRDADDPEVRRRYALSLGIAGRRDEALRQIEPLLRISDRGAWRARAFILAMTGDVAEAERVAGQTMPPAMVAAIRPFLALLVRMAPADRAFAVHFGEVRVTPARIADARLTPALPALGPDPDARAVQVAAAPPPPMSRAERARQRRAERAQARQAARERLASRKRRVPAPARSGAPAPARSDEDAGERERTRLAALERRRAMVPPGSMVASPPPQAVPAARAPASPGFGEPAPAAATTTPPPAPAAPLSTSGAPAEAVAASPGADPRPAPAAPAPAPPITAPTPSPAPQPVLAPAPQQVLVPPPPTLPAADTSAARAAPIPAPLPAEVAGPPVPDELRAARGAPPAVVAPVPLPRDVAGPPAPADLRPAPPAAAPPAAAPPPAPAPSGPPAQAVAGPPAPVAALPATVQPLPPASGSSAVAATPTASPTRDREVLARIIAGIVIPGAELGVAPPPTRDPVAPAAERAAEPSAAAAAAPAPAPDPEAARREAAARRAEEARAAAAKKAADARAAAAKRAADEKTAAARKAAEERAAERKAARAEPARYWVQVAGGANEADLAKAWAAVRAKSSLLAGRTAFSTPLRATNRVVTGPFKTEAEAQDFVNRLAKQGVSAFTFASAPGQKMTRLGTR